MRSTTATSTRVSVVTNVGEITLPDAPADYTQGSDVSALIGDLVTHYRDSDPKGKAAIRKSVENAGREALKALNMSGTLFYTFGVSPALTVGAKPEKEQVPVATLAAQHVHNLRRAADLIMSGEVTFDGADLSDIVAAYQSDGVTFDDASAKKLAGAKLSRSGERHDLQSAIDRAFDGLESGTFLTIAQIRTRGTEGTYVPSDGLIGVRLFPPTGRPMTLTGVTPVDATATTARGATKK